MATDYDDPNFDWAAYGAAREVKPERELLHAARNGDELAAQALLLWPKLYRREMIDPEVYEAIVAGALDVAAYVANECKSPKPNKKENVAKVKASMFFNGAAKKKSMDSGKDVERKNARIALAVANGRGDSACLSELELRIALTRKFDPMMKEWQLQEYLSRKKTVRPKLIRGAEARLVEYIRWKYSPHVTQDAIDAGRDREEPLALDEDLCKSLIAVSFPDIQWHRDASEPFPYPPDWDAPSET